MTVEPPNIDMKRLKYFIAVCNNGGFSRAASAIGIAQPALTRQIKLLEKQIGLPLDHSHQTGRGADGGRKIPSRQGGGACGKPREHVA